MINPFDFNHDGQLDITEQAAQFSAFMTFMDQQQAEKTALSDSEPSFETLTADESDPQETISSVGSDPVDFDGL